MKKTLTSFLLSLFLLFSASSAFATSDSEGKKQLEGTITELIAALTDTELAKDRLERRNKIKSILNQRFSATEMAKRTLLRGWKALNKEERKEFSTILRRLIISSYIGKIEGYKDEKVIFQNEQCPKERYMEIETTVLGGTNNYAVNYKLKDFRGEWLIYDITIEGVSLITNYRSQFHAFLKRNTIQDLINSLQEKLKKIEDKDLLVVDENKQ